MLRPSMDKAETERSGGKSPRGLLGVAAFALAAVSLAISCLALYSAHDARSPGMPRTPAQPQASINDTGEAKRAPAPAVAVPSAQRQTEERQPSVPLRENADAPKLPAETR